MAEEAFVERRFALQPDREVTLRIFRPEPEEFGWRCAFHIAWPDRDERFTRWAVGSDPVQAFELAMQMAHLNLLVSPERRAGLLTWSGRPELGLPLPGNFKPEDFD